MEQLNLDMNKRYSYADYLTWFDDVRRELYNGFIHLLSPSPNLKHQIIAGNLHLIIGNYLNKKQCKVFFAPSDVRFPKNNNKEDKQIFTVVQPDIYIVCDLEKLDEKDCIGAPDLIIEVITPKYGKRDVKDKFKIYEENGVREYWIVHPNDETVIVFLLDETGKFAHSCMYAGNDKIPVAILGGNLEVDLTEVFE